jgi:hypothetical protein
MPATGFELVKLPNRIARLYRKSRSLYEGGGGLLRVASYNARYAMLKFPVLAGAVGARMAVPWVRRRIAETAGTAPTLCIHSPGAGIGDQVVIARFLRDLDVTAGPIIFDIATADPDRARWVFGGVRGFRECQNPFAFESIASCYTAALEISHIVRTISRDGETLSLSQNRRLALCLDAAATHVKKNLWLVEELPYSTSELARRAVYSNQNRATYLHAQARIAYRGDALPLACAPDALAKFGLSDRSFITVHNGFDPDFVTSTGSATKSFPSFDRVIEQLRRLQPTIHVVQLGSSTSTPIDGVDTCLIGRTTLPEVASVILASKLHVDNDSGLVHIAASMGTRALVVFGPTDAEYFAYPGHLTARASFCGGCWWTTESWMDQCPRGFAVAKCMTSHDPMRLARAIAQAVGDEPVAAPLS